MYFNKVNDPFIFFIFRILRRLMCGFVYYSCLGVGKLKYSPWVLSNAIDINLKFSAVGFSAMYLSIIARCL